jgi:hypothetical protein
MPSRGRLCLECEERGNGKCSRCFGTGVNTQLNSPDSKCPNCGGTGKCPGCNGTGNRQLRTQ